MNFDDEMGNKNNKCKREKYMQQTNSLVQTPKLSTCVAICISFGRILEGEGEK